MQINKVNHEWLREKLGITDFLDPEQSILSGVYMLSDLTRKYEDPHRIYRKEERNELLPRMQCLRKLPRPRRKMRLRKRRKENERK